MYSIYVCSIRGGACVLNLYVCSIRAMSGLGVLHLCVLNLYLYLYLYEWTIRRGNLANTNQCNTGGWVGGALGRE